MTAGPQPWRFSAFRASSFLTSGSVWGLWLVQECPAPLCRQLLLRCLTVHTVKSGLLPLHPKAWRVLRQSTGNSCILSGTCLFLNDLSILLLFLFLAFLSKMMIPTRQIVTMLLGKTKYFCGYLCYWLLVLFMDTLLQEFS